MKEIQEDDKLELKNRNQYVHSETAFPISSLLPLSFQLSPFSFYYVPHCGVEVAEVLSLSSPTVSRIVENGENILDDNRKLALELA